MKLKRIFAGIIPAALAVSMMTISAGATNWANASYADDNPDTVKIISTSADKVTFTATADGVAPKCRVSLSDLVADPADIPNIKSMSWTVTYDGFTPDVPAENNGVTGIGGGTYAATTNSVGYWINPEFDDAGAGYWANSSYSAEDSVKYLLPTSVPQGAEGEEMVFMDWSNFPLVSNNITISILNFKIFDADGNEIAQAEYAGGAAPAADAPASDAGTTTSAGTGNTAAMAIAAVMALAGTAAVISRKRK